MRKALSILVVVCTLLAWGIAVSAQSTAISLSEAVKLALEQDINQKIALITWENAKIAYEKNMANNLLAESAYDAKVAELNRMKAENAYLNSIADVVISTVTQFYDLKKMELDVKINEQKLALSKKQVALTKQKIATQNASEFDLLQAEAAEATSAYNLEKARDDFAEKLSEFALLIGRENVELGDGLSFVPFTVDLDAVLKQVVENSVTVKERIENVALASLEFDKLKLEGAAELSLREAENALKLAELQLQQSIDNTRNNVITSYNTVGHAALSYNLSLKNYEIELRKYQVTEKQVAAGLKTQDDLVNAQISLREMENSRDTALKNYLVSFLQFEKLIGKDLRNSAIFDQLETTSK